MEAQSVKSTAHNQDGDFSRFPLLLGTWYGFCEDLCALEIRPSWIYLHVLFTSHVGIYSCSCWHGHLILVFFYSVSYGVLQLFEDNSDLVDASCKDYDLFEH
ncbi:hypothetical protein NC652_003660 [Populus alba x Populus x berolinensis]|uniref:Uncharacterized protein n=1 Tax=Populus alba x Populus x berolinensis TaxID=444605 RepID=A0AAD6WJG5_9ROSI|nr:hypothetical protein NC652_003660 [Populus alba x Populus x berolinensis]KAJ7014196.1 hypothetical protein NC653_003722 [Populus alba x Populus x berolinensis]